MAGRKIISSLQKIYMVEKNTDRIPKLSNTKQVL